MNRLALFAFLALSSCDGKRSEPVPPVSPPVVPVAPSNIPVPFTFAVYGDCRDGHDTHRKICANILKSDARFVINSGDLVAEGGKDDLWKIFREITRDLRSKLPYYSSPGNHETYGDKELARFLAELHLEKPYFDQRLGNIHFFFLDSNDLDDAQLAWLDAAAAKSDARHKIAVFHHPPFTLVAKRSGGAEKIREKIHSRLVKMKFCAAICGHDHDFYTTVRDGVRYVISGGGGAPTYSMKESLAAPGDLFREFHHSLLLRVDDRSIGVRVFDTDGAEVPELGFPLCAHR